MTDLPACELFVDGVQTGATNMSRDESLLERITAQSDSSFVRIYGWAEPTVSLGYFQKSDAEIDSRLTECPRVRRVTGGGAILHDHELTYSCAVPDTHSVRANPVALYVLIHSAVIDLLADCGVQCCLRQDFAGETETQSDEPFLCFLRSDPRDVVMNGQKILGSAQRRRRGNILQHGSILLHASSLTPEIPGILDLQPDMDVVRFTNDLPNVVADAVSDNVVQRDWFAD